jgi:hypothetical protein
MQWPIDPGVLVLGCPQWLRLCPILWAWWLFYKYLVGITPRDSRDAPGRHTFSRVNHLMKPKAYLLGSVLPNVELFPQQLTDFFAPEDGWIPSTTSWPFCPAHSHRPLSLRLAGSCCAPPHLAMFHRSFLLHLSPGCCLASSRHCLRLFALFRLASPRLALYLVSHGPACLSQLCERFSWDIPEPESTPSHWRHDQRKHEMVQQCRHGYKLPLDTWSSVWFPAYLFKIWDSFVDCYERHFWASCGLIAGISQQTMAIIVSS